MSQPIHAVIYAAKSTEDRHGSIPTQIEDCRELAKRAGLQVAAEFSDERASAYKSDRGQGLADALAECERLATEFGTAALVVQHSDRLARGDGRTAKHLVEYALWAMKREVTIRSAQDPQTFGDLLYAVVTGQRNAEDSQRKGAATRAGKRRRFERGDSAGPLPFGYRLVEALDERGHVVTEGDRVVKRRVPDEDEGPVVVRMFRMLDEGHGIGEITRWVNGQGVRTKRGNPFGRNGVHEILRNPWYAGKVRSYGELRDGNHEALLAWDEFRRITAKLDREDPASMKKRQGGRPSQVALLSGVLFCGHCGHGIWHRRNGQRRHYMCGNVRHATGVCDADKLDAGRADQAVLEHLDSLFVDFSGWLEDVSAQRAAQRDLLVRQLAALHDRRAALDRDEELVQADYMKQLRSGNERAADLATSQLDRIARDREELDAELGDLDARLTEWDEPQPADAILDWWNELRDALRDGVVGAGSVKEANTALRERFAAIYVKTTGDSARLDFVLKEREPGSPLVSSRLWAEGEIPTDGTLIDFVHHGPAPERVLPVELVGSRSYR